MSERRAAVRAGFHRLDRVRPSPGVQALTADGTVWHLDGATNQFVQVYGLTGITAIGGSTYISYAIR